MKTTHQKQQLCCIHSCNYNNHSSGITLYYKYQEFSPFTFYLQIYTWMECLNSVLLLMKEKSYPATLELHGTQSQHIVWVNTEVEHVSLLNSSV